MGRTEIIFLHFRLGCGFCCWFIKQSVFMQKRIFWESKSSSHKKLMIELITLSSIKGVFIFCLLGLAQHSYANVRQKCADCWPCIGLCSKHRHLFMFRMLILFANYFGTLAIFAFTVSENISVFWFYRESLYHILCCSVKNSEKRKKNTLFDSNQSFETRTKKFQLMQKNILLKYQGFVSILSSYFSTSLIFIISWSFTAIN